MLELNPLDQVLEEKSKAVEEESCEVLIVLNTSPHKKTYSLKTESDGSVPCMEGKALKS